MSGENKKAGTLASVWPLLLGLVCFSMGQTLIFAIAGPVFRESGLTETDLGWVVSAAAVSYTIVAPIWGRVSDRWGRLPVLMFGLVGYAVTTVAFALAMGAGMEGVIAPTLTFILLLGIRITLTLASGGVHPASTAYMADRTSAEDRSAGLALTGAAFGFGSVAGPFMGGGLSSFGLLVPLYVSAGLCVVAALLIKWRMTEPTTHEHTDAAGKVSPIDSRIRGFVLMALATFSGVAILQQTTAFYVQDLLQLSAGDTAQSVGWIIGSMALCTLLAQAVIVQALKPEPRTLLLSGYVLIAASGGAILLTSDLTGTIAAFAIYGLGFGLVNPGLTSGASLRVESHEQGATAGAIAAGMGAGFIFGPILGTWSYAQNMNAPAVLIIALGSCLFVATLAMGRAQKPITQEEAA